MGGLGNEPALSLGAREKSNQFEAHKKASLTGLVIFSDSYLSSATLGMAAPVPHFVPLEVGDVIDRP